MRKMHEASLTDRADSTLTTSGRAVRSKRAPMECASTWMCTTPASRTDSKKLARCNPISCETHSFVAIG